MTDILDKEIRKHVAEIHTDANLSFLQRKLANVLLLNTHPHLPTQETHRIRVRELAEVLDFDSNDRKYLPAALFGLMKTVFKWNVTYKKGVEHDWEACVLLYRASICVPGAPTSTVQICTKSSTNLRSMRGSTWACSATSPVVMH